MFAINLKQSSLFGKEVWWHIGGGYLACKLDEPMPSETKLYPTEGDAQSAIAQLESDSREAYKGHTVVSVA